MKEALSSSETSVLTRAIRRNIPEGAILHGHRREILKSYILILELTEIGCTIDYWEDIATTWSEKLLIIISHSGQ
jgi:hypothetical protein